MPLTRRQTRRSRPNASLQDLTTTAATAHASATLSHYRSAVREENEAQSRVLPGHVGVLPSTRTLRDGSGSSAPTRPGSPPFLCKAVQVSRTRAVTSDATGLATSRRRSRPPQPAPRRRSSSRPCSSCAMLLPIPVARCRLPGARPAGSLVCYGPAFAGVALKRATPANGSSP